MRFLAFFAGCLLFAASARAADPQPLKLVPAEANLVVRVDHPRRLVESITGLDLVQQMQMLPFVREQLQSPAAQRFFQLVAYYERDLGLKWPELLDKLAGHGITLAVKAGADNAPLLLIVDGTDAELTGKFVKLALLLMEQELARQEAKEKVEKADYRGVPVVKFGDLHVAQIGPRLVVSNKNEGMKAALDLHVAGGKSLADAVNSPAAARKALPENCLATLWLNLDVARNAPNAKEMFALPSDNPLQLFAVGGWLNVIKRAPFLAAGLYRDKDAFHVSLRFPGGGRDGLPEALALHVPPAGQPGGMPLLEPKGVILSHSFYFDFNVLYQKRSLLFNEKISKDFEDAEKQAKKFLFGNSLSSLAAQSGPYHRVVVAYREPTAYQTKPKQYIPAIAYVNTMRDPALAKPMEGILRGIALTAGNAYNPKSFEETHAGVRIVGYRFPENVTVADDPNNTRYNFSPCFAAVGNQYLMCSTIEFGREMIELLQREVESSRYAPHPHPFRTRLFADGGVGLLHAFEEQVLGQIVLDQAVKPDEARQQLEALAAWARRLGQVELRSEYRDKEFRFDVEWKMKK